MRFVCQRMYRLTLDRTIRYSRATIVPRASRIACTKKSAFNGFGLESEAP
jgi:hypothetical protein